MRGKEQKMNGDLSVTSGERPEAASEHLTPRVDAKCRVHVAGDRYMRVDHVPAEFARELERENAQLLEALQALMDAPSELEYHGLFADKNCALCVAVNKARAAIAAAKVPA